MSRSPNLAYVAWMFKNASLSSVVERVLSSLEELAESEWFYAPGMAMDESAEPCTVGVLGQSTSAEKCAGIVCGVVAQDFDLECESALWLAELFSEFPEVLDEINRLGARDTFLYNWKFDRHMRSGGPSMIAAGAYLVSPLVDPPDLGYSEFLAGIFGVLQKQNDKPCHIICLHRKLLECGIEVDLAFLACVIRNEERLLLVKSGAGISVARIDVYVRGWRLAVELLEPQECFSSEGLQYDDISFDKVLVKPNVKAMMGFFRRHDWEFSLDCLDTLELALKLRVWQTKPQEYVQGIPATVYRRIFDWLKENRSVWTQRQAQRVLGKRYRIPVEKVSPGPLLVYGNSKGITSSERVGLVLREMVSEGSQTRGKIHGSRVLTPLEDFEFGFNLRDVQRLVLRDKMFRKWGIIDVDSLVEHAFIVTAVKRVPYFMNVLEVLFQSRLEAYLEPVGMGLFVDFGRYPQVRGRDVMREKRSMVRAAVLPENVTWGEFLETLEPPDRKILSKLSV